MFKRGIVLSAVLMACFLAVGCYSVKMTAPPNSDVKLLAPAAPVSFKTVQRNWFVLFGLAPVANAENGVMKTIAENNLTEVRVTTKQTFIDWLISGFLGMATIATTTTVIEGNSQ
jgi:hypothetical protein